MDIAVTAFTPADSAAVERAFEIQTAVVTADIPGFPTPVQRDFYVGMKHPRTGYTFERYLAHVDGNPVGYLEMTMPQLDNTDNVTVELQVLPDYRRRGVGRALHARAVERARALGRKRLMTMAVATLPGGPVRDEAGNRFAAAMGAESVLVEVRRRLDVTSVDQPRLDAMLTEAWKHADGYEPVRWVGATPEDLIDDVAYLDGRLVEDAPMGDLEWEPEKVDADRIRKVDQNHELRGRRMYHSGLRHVASGRLAAWTEITLADGNEWHAFQQITIVEPAHRGHRLGTIVKIDNLRQVLANEPDLKVIDTWNAAANDHMISINEAIGFRAVDTWNNWQQAV
ncbi:GNAT family N-acetyltransferase [Polymorphospora sp. NPDC050346]|uniref:GNAT family N-acetyltransferase n=1 Tax=Polymorphospora sp. NPDC050346 TaxID=3155780 RepID=UPI00340757A5